MIEPAAINMSKEDKLHNRPRYQLFLIFLAIWLIVLLPDLPGPTQAPNLARAAAPEHLPEKEAFNLGLEAYIYGYPLVMMETVRRVMTNVATPEGFHAPFGQFGHMRQYPDASFRGVRAPNQDTLYSFAWLDLSKEPYVLSLPDEKGRYYVMEMLDAWTNVFADPGTRTSGTRAQMWAITGPGWHGQVPRGIKQIKAPTNMVWVVGRTYCSGTPEDYEAVHNLQDQYRFTPLSACGKPYTPPRGTVDPNVDMKTSGWEQVSRMDAAQYFKTLAAALKANPPAARDRALLARLTRIGLIPGHDFDMSKLPPPESQGLAEVPPTAQKKIMSPEKNSGIKVNGWTYTLKTGVYGTDYLQRAYLTAVDLGANLPQDMVFPATRVDSRSQPLNGAHRYVLHFPKGQTPPVKGFWSLTMYNADSYFVANPLNRYRLNSWSKFLHNQDGSLDIYLQKDSPGQDKEANWLPAPQDTFSLMLRLYWPKEAFLKGDWQPPAVKQID